MNINLGEGSGHSYGLFKTIIAAFLPKQSKPAAVLYVRVADGAGVIVAIGIDVFVNDDLCIQWGGSVGSASTFATDFPDAIEVGVPGSTLPPTAPTQ